MTVRVSAAIATGLLEFVAPVRLERCCRSPCPAAKTLPRPARTPGPGVAGAHASARARGDPAAGGHLRGEFGGMIPEILFLKGFGLNRTSGSARSLSGCTSVWPGPGARVACVARLAGRLLGAAGRQAGSRGLARHPASRFPRLLQRRLSDPTLRAYPSAGDIFNLLLFAAALGTLGPVPRPAGGAPGALASPWASCHGLEPAVPCSPRAS
jgi:hypothetical protein